MMKTKTKNGTLMKRTILLSIASILALSFGSGCAEPEPSIIMNAHVFATGLKAEKDEKGVETRDTSGCKAAKFGEDGNRIAHELFADVSATTPGVGLLMKNQLLSTEELAQIGKDSNLRVDTNSIQLSKMVATFSPNGPLKSIGDGGSIVVPIGSLISTAGSLHSFIKLARFKDAADLAKAVEKITDGKGSLVTSVDLQVFGKTLGGNEVTSNVLTMPIELCYGRCEGRELSATPFCVK